MNSSDKYTVNYLQYKLVDEEDETQILDMDFDLKERSSEQIASPASMRDQDEPCLINKMPAEIIAAIVSELTPCRRTCLGVTCKDIYQYFKYLSPKLIDLSERAGSKFQNKPLHMLLKTWIGPQYRRGVLIPHHYLLKSMYGESQGLPDSGKKLELAHRYIDYRRSSKPRVMEDRKMRIHPFLLSNPCNKGDSWNEEALEVMREDLKSRLDDHTQWFHYWNFFHVFGLDEYRHYKYLLLRRKQRMSDIAWCIMLSGGMQ
ncbi:uncharacterized protein EAE97_007268 [Botrytis byssoidea]|uniref:F-box domain-containing protein n=1 Tax=Botrytis byssoidea TaxID=139641 RepID=A0A9P5IH69_9HELO|nr:uncharacterized protein EAE97_007268 [Botrytis byssoidea]KAF7939187.1 hypothetical protein EAE97_007268 [Botrytis byssoidea]